MNSALPLLFFYTKTLKVVAISHFLKISHNASDPFLPKRCHFPTVTAIEFNNGKCCAFCIHLYFSPCNFWLVGLM